MMYRVEHVEMLDFDERDHLAYHITCLDIDALHSIFHDNVFRQHFDNFLCKSGCPNLTEF